MLTLVKNSAAAFRSLLYPARCEQCAGPVVQDAYLCAPCRESAKAIARPFCETCSEPFHGAIEQEFSCSNCVGRDFYFTHAVASFRSRGVVRALIHRFKYQHQFHLRFPLADWLLVTLDDARLAAPPIDALVPVPLHQRRFREREFNQATVLAGLVGARRDLPVDDCLLRVRYTTTQTRYDRGERMENLRNAFALRQTAQVRGRHLVLVDDVLTTGSTLNECARMLMKAGAASVRAITVARG